MTEPDPKVRAQEPVVEEAADRAPEAEGAPAWAVRVYARIAATL